MSHFVPGSFVAHAKLPELGNGEVLSADKGTLRLRFACGERSFLLALASQHFSQVLSGPATRPSAATAKRSRKAAAKRNALES